MLFISGGMNEAPLGYPGRAGHWLRFLLCCAEGAPCVFKAPGSQPLTHA